MIGNGYWAVGITVRYSYSGMNRYGWGASIDFCDDGFCSDNTDSGTISTEGTIRTRYYVHEGNDPDVDALTVAIDVIKADAERIGIRFRHDGMMTPHVYYKGDGEDKAYPPPVGWRELIDAQSARLGWEGLYAGSPS
jgi:hypothetical protein